MDRVFESILIIVLFVVAILLKEAAHIDIIYIIISGALIVLLYAVHQIVQHKRGSMIEVRFPWLLKIGKMSDPHSLAHIESRAASKTNIYLITPDLYNDAKNVNTQAVVESNLQRGITYFYLTRNDNDIAEHMFLKFCIAFLYTRIMF